MSNNVIKFPVKKQDDNQEVDPFQELSQTLEKLQKAHMLFRFKLSELEQLLDKK